MAQSDARFGYRSKLGRTDHNLSQPFGFTCAPGMLLPIWEDFATPGDSYYIQHDLPLLRSNVLVAPSMVDVKVHYETFFVPIQMIYQPFENSNFAISPYLSSFITSSNDNGNLPLLDYAGTLGSITVPAAKFEAFRLIDMLGLQAENVCDDPGGAGVPHKGGLSDYTPNFFPWQLCAYHCIYQNYFRLDDKSLYNNDYNLDVYHSANTFRGVSLFGLRYRAWDFDYYTSMYRSPIISNDNVNAILPSGKYQSLVSLDTNSINSAGTANPTPANISAYSVQAIANYSAGALRQAVSTAVIRQMFANEKLAMITGRTKKNYDSQVLAHYGVSVPHDVKHDITLLKHDVYDLHVQEVTSLSATNDAPLGDLAGKSYASGQGKQFKFTAPCHGVIMTIFSIEPKRRYIGGFDRINAVTDTFSLPTPEFDRLGNTPMYGYECGKLIDDSSAWNAADIIGWKERYYQWKRKPAKCTLFALNPNQTNYYGSFFLASRPFAFVRNTQLPTQQGGTVGADAPKPQNEEEFYINPAFFDNLCTVNYQPNWQANGFDNEDWNYSPWLAYARDPFIVDSFIKCKKVSWMSKDGEPIYD